MNIVVSAAAARESGALMIYKQFLHYLQTLVKEDHYYIFVNPEMPMPEISGVTYFPVTLWKNIWNRIRFDAIGCRKFLEDKGIQADKVVSLQNTGVRSLRGLPQLIYYHQPAPFYPIHWNPLKGEERKMFLYKHIYPFFVRESLTKQTHVVVQIPFIRDGFLRRFHFDPERVHVLFPDVKVIDRTQVSAYSYDSELSHFIYPATGWVYKNHRLLIDALQIIRRQKPEVLSTLRVHLSLSEQDAPGLAATIREAGLAGIVLLEGGVPYDVLLEKYAACKALLFPSRMETLGLPLLEAASLGLPVLAPELAYAHNVLDGYAGVQFLPLEDPALWAESIASLAARPLQRFPYDKVRESSWPEFFRIVAEM